MKVNRIILLNSSIDYLGDKYVKTVNYSCYPPLGLVSIATAIKNHAPHIEIKILDAEILPMSEIEDCIATFLPDIIGISVLTATFETGLHYADFAKKTGVRYVVFGNDHASFFPELIIRNRCNVDYVLAGDNGEIDFVKFIDSIEKEVNVFDHVSNIVGRQNKTIFKSKSVKLALEEYKNNTIDIPDFNLLEKDILNTYWNSYNHDFGYFHSKEKRPLTINNAKGCTNFSNHCLYCGIFSLKPQWGNASFFWQMIERYWKRFNANLFFEVCDNFTGLIKYRKELIRLMPEWYKQSDIEMIVYSRAFDIYNDKELIDDLKKLHVVRVIIGLESGSKFSINSLRKGHPTGLEVEINKYAIEKLAEADIQLHSSFILGCLGESCETVNETRNFINWLKGFKNVVGIEVSPLYPVPTSPSWDLLLGNKNSAFYENIEETLRNVGIYDYKEIWENANELFANKDIIDCKLASNFWLDNFTHLSSAVIEKEIVDLNKMIKSEFPINTGAFL
ncbi:MAG TPA: cobalamin-dependent protein [Bacteroidales bacterium]|nr:cobalamin-dependent protein [Bacteroidales bacterium]HSA42352.1 cobalamin-dependent protein [Bacteroidales bacterium]